MWCAHCKSPYQGYVFKFSYCYLIWEGISEECGKQNLQLDAKTVVNFWCKGVGAIWGNLEILMVCVEGECKMLGQNTQASFIAFRFPLKSCLLKICFSQWIVHLILDHICSYIHHITHSHNSHITSLYSCKFWMSKDRHSKSYLRMRI